MLRNLFLACALSAISQVQTASALEIDGNWELAFSPRPKITVIALGQPLKQGLPVLPKSDTITFTEDPEAPGTGTFSSSLFEGEWLVDGKKVASTAVSSSLVESTMNQFLAKGEFYGYEFTDGRLLSSKSALQAKELKNGDIKGSLTHVSKWTVHLLEPKEMDVKVLVKLTAKFIGTHATTQ